MFCLGLNHTTAPLAIRERFFVAAANIPGLLSELTAFSAEILVLSTCNRLEIYGTENAANQALTKHLADYFALPIGEFEPLLYHYVDQDAVVHLTRVACGLDSMVVGEPQVLGQLKEAYRLAEQNDAIGKHFSQLLPFIFASAKKVRTETAVGQHPVSMASSAISLAKHIFNDLKQTRVLLIGAGEMIQLAAQHLFDVPVAKIIIANRSRERAQSLAEQVNGESIAIGEIPQYLADIDMVFSCTASQLPILGKGLVERSLKTRKHKPMFMVDLAVPRDIEAEVAELPDVYLYNIDDLQHVLQENQRLRAQAANEADKMIEVEIAHFDRWKNSLEVMPTIKAYREQIEAWRIASVTKALQDLQQGKAAADVVEELSRQLANKLMHEPTVQMRQASYEGQHDLLSWAKKLLGIAQ